MPSKRVPSVKVNARLHPTLYANVTKRIRERGDGNLSDYVRSLIEQDLQRLPNEDRISQLESLIEGNHTELTRSLRYLHMAVRVQYTVFEETAKLLLGFPVPFPTKELEHAVLARGEGRFRAVTERAGQSNFETLTQTLNKLNDSLERALAAAGLLHENQNS
jgi:hypothetical protein